MKKKLTYLAEFIGALILASFLFIFGFLYNFIRPIVIFKRIGGKKATKEAFLFVFEFIKELINSIFFILHVLALLIDKLGNVIVGYLIQDIISSEKNSLFGKANVTVSASTGELTKKGKINKAGVLFNKMLDVVFGKNHSTTAYFYYKKIEELKDYIKKNR